MPTLLNVGAGIDKAILSCEIYSVTLAQWTGRVTTPLAAIQQMALGEIVQRAINHHLQQVGMDPVQGLESHPFAPRIKSPALWQAINASQGKAKQHDVHAPVGIDLDRQHCGGAKQTVQQLNELPT